MSQYIIIFLEYGMKFAKETFFSCGGIVETNSQMFIQFLPAYRTGDAPKFLQEASADRVNWDHKARHRVVEQEGMIDADTLIDVERYFTAFIREGLPEVERNLTDEEIFKNYLWGQMIDPNSLLQEGLRPFDVRLVYYVFRKQETTEEKSDAR